MTRPTTDQRFMALTELAKTWGTCPRLPVGAVVARGPEIVALGFNGAPSGQRHCVDVGCLVENDHCIRAMHAESNALWLAGRERTPWATLYVSHFPCYHCANEIVRAGIARVVYGAEYKMDERALHLLLGACRVQQFVDGKVVCVRIPLVVQGANEVQRTPGVQAVERKGAQ
jgi:dCMP deaminase